MRPFLVSQKLGLLGLSQPLELGEGQYQAPRGVVARLQGRHGGSASEAKDAITGSEGSLTQTEDGLHGAGAEPRHIGRPETMERLRVAVPLGDCKDERATRSREDRGAANP